MSDNSDIVWVLQFQRLLRTEMFEAFFQAKTHTKNALHLARQCPGCINCIKGGRWMPGLEEAMKDVLGCDKPRGAAKKH